MLFDLLHIVYRLLAAILLIFIVAELFTQVSWKQKACAALILMPLILRVLMIR